MTIKIAQAEPCSFIPERIDAAERLAADLKREL